MKASASLLPLSAAYRVVTQARLAAYRRGWFSVTKLPAPVISIGNLTTGGTGKTPLVEWICRAAVKMRGDERAPRVCVLTRGYGRDNPKSQVVVSNGTELLANEREAGDEPLLLAENLLGMAAVICNLDRVAAANWASENLKTELFVLDDGFQHLRLARDLDIVTIDATNPWGVGGGRLLPYGRLREPRTGLGRADCVVITRTDQVDDDATALMLTVADLAGDASVFSSRMVTGEIRRLGGANIALEDIVAEPLAAFCGVGNPESFIDQLRHEGIEPVVTRTFADHHRYRQSELNALEQEAKARGASGLITTAKDAVKLSSLNFELPCYVLEIKVSIDDEDRLIEMIRKVQRPKSKVQSRCIQVV